MDERKRLFQWKTLLITGRSIIEARDTLVAWIRRRYGEEEVGEEMLAWLDDQTRYFEDDLYDSVNPREYLHAIDPERFIELDAGRLPKLIRSDVDVDIPVGLRGVSETDMVVVADELYAVLGGVSVSLDARAWAKLLPHCWVHCVEPDGSII